MKRIDLTIYALAIAALHGLSACDDQGHDHDRDNDQAAHSEGGDDDKGGDDHAHEGDDADDHGHPHDNIIAGPNGGRVLTEVEPHAEFFVTGDRKVQITFVDDDINAVTLGEQSVSVIAGDRSNPTNLAFARSGETLISDKALPEGNDFPTVVQIKTSPEAEMVRVRFNVNLEDCPTCDQREYACTCDH